MKNHATIAISVLIWCFPPASRAQEDTWSHAAPMPAARESLASCVVDDKIYALGGVPEAFDNALTTNERYDPVSDSWSTMASMATTRWLPATGTVNGKCYVIGGDDTDPPTAADSVEEYDPGSNSWRNRASMPTSRYGHASAVVDGLIYVIGGTDGFRIIQEVEVYDPVSDQWTTLGPMPAPRACLGAAALNGKIYVMGGSLDCMFSTFDRLDIYDPRTDTWSVGATMPIARFNLSASAINDRVYAIGGALGALTWTRNMHAYDPISDSWTATRSMFTNRARFTTSVAADRIYAIGGTPGPTPPNVSMDLVEYYTPLAALPTFSINAGLNDAWYNPATNGQGFLIAVFPVIKQIFVAWFTYDTERPPENVEAILGEPGHRWLTAQGPYNGSEASLTISVTEGGVFDATEPPASNDGIGEGKMTIEFADCSQGLVIYEMNSPEVSGEIPIQRIASDNVALCEALSTAESSRFDQ
jgi:N-acetylneuraminic acid mutarotase